MSEKAAPRVSIVMGVYNCASTLDQALESVATQSFPDWELVVCDDGSTDETPAILDQWQTRMPDQVVVLRNERNARLAYSLNRCLGVARGEYIARMDGDDISVPHRLERQVTFLDEARNVDLVGTWMRRFSDAGEAEIVSVEEYPDRWSLRSGAPFCHATVMARKSVFQRVGGYAETARAVRNEDLDLWFRFFEAGLTGANLQEPLYLVREDLSAIRRRTVRGRWNVFLTTIHGFWTLRYPLWWYPRPVVSLAKALVPSRGVAMYRTFQKSRARARSV